MSESVPRVLSIAGSDSGGGAGIQADIKTIAALGGYPMSAITAVTAQNTQGVYAVEVVEPAMVRKQVEAVVGDIGVDAVKTGMLANPAIVEEVASVASELGLDPLVVDPVLVAESGASLLEDAARVAIVEKLMPLATVITPNAVEAGRLLAMEVKDVEDQRRAAIAFVEHGATAAVVKGGHLPGENAVDVLYLGGEIYHFSAPRLDGENTHGTGCIFAAALAFHLACGLPIPDSVENAKEFVSQAIEHGLDLGQGAGPANPMTSATLSHLSPQRNL